MPEENCQKVKLLKLMELLRQETDEHHPMTTEMICQRLAENGIDCERRTLALDIQALNNAGYVLTDTGLVLLQNLWLKFALSIPRYGYLYIPEAGTQCLAAVSVSAIVRFLVLVVIFAVPEFLIQFCIKPVLHELSNRFLE